MSEKKVVNLKTNEEIFYVGISAEQAVIAAYAQERKDLDTQNYDRYSKLVQRGACTVTCGDWCCVRDDVR